VVSDHPVGHAEEPQTVLGRLRDHLETAPSNAEDLGDDVAGVLRTNASADVVRNRLALRTVERLEPLRTVGLLIARSHSTSVHSLSLTQLHGRDTPKSVNTRPLRVLHRP
jgi:hypothetical protein